MQERIDEINRVLREQITGIRVVRAFVREKEETRRFARGQRRTHGSVAARRAADVVDVPDRQHPRQHVERRRAVARRAAACRRRRDPGRHDRRLPELPRADPDVGDDGDVHGVDDPPRRGVGRSRAKKCSTRRRRSSPPANRRRRGTPGAGRVPQRRLPLSGRRTRRACRTSRSSSNGARPRRSSVSSGSGKTTLVNLVARLFDATSGAVLVDGVDVRELEPAPSHGSHRPRAAEDRSCSPARSRSNLRYGKPDATEKEMWAALRVAQAEDFVKQDARQARRRASSKAAPTCRAVSASASRSPAR